jgi:hypothetical protein
MAFKYGLQNKLLLERGLVRCSRTTLPSKRVDLQRANLLQAATLKKKLPVCEFLGLRSGVDKPAVLLGYDNAPLDK